VAEKSSTSLWKETTAIAKDLAKEVQIAQAIYGWECVHCKGKAWYKDASRLAFQLSGNVGLRDAVNGITGIEVCLQIPSAVAYRAKIEMVAKTAKKARKSSLSATGKLGLRRKATCALKGRWAHSRT
jgi:hypothetical protein